MLKDPACRLFLEEILVDDGHNNRCNMSHSGARGSKRPSEAGELNSIILRNCRGRETLIRNTECCGK